MSHIPNDYYLVPKATVDAQAGAESHDANGVHECCIGYQDAAPRSNAFRDGGADTYVLKTESGQDVTGTYLEGLTVYDHEGILAELTVANGWSSEDGV